MSVRQKKGFVSFIHFEGIKLKKKEITITIACYMNYTGNVDDVGAQHKICICI